MKDVLRIQDQALRHYSLHLDLDPNGDPVEEQLLDKLADKYQQLWSAQGRIAGLESDLATAYERIDALQDELRDYQQRTA